MYSQKILQSAKLLNIKASVIERRMMERSFGAKFSKLLEDSFEKQGKIRLQDIQDFYKKEIPSIDIDVVNLENGGLSYKYTNENEDVINGFTLKLPCSDGKHSIQRDDALAIGIAEHENGHLTRAIYEPKYTIASQKGKLTQNQYELQGVFYKNNIYANELSNLSRSKQKELSSDINSRKAFIKNSIKNFFDANNFSSSEKIEILKKWRIKLADEQKGYKTEIFSHVKNYGKNLTNSLNKGKDIIVPGENGIAFNSKMYHSLDEKISTLKSFIKKAQAGTYRDYCRNQLFLPEKRKIVKELLLDEIQAYRLELAKNRETGELSVNKAEFSQIANC